MILDPLILDPRSMILDFSRFKSNSESGGSRQLEVFGKPVFTEAGGSNQREKSAIRWGLVFLESKNFLWRVYSICMNPQEPWGGLEIEPWEEGEGGGDLADFWETNFLRQKLTGAWGQP